jgi:sugar O-acyltransferase (sialic acid O-acetyltransferase NeuD family)
MKRPPAILLGAGGHARVVRALAEALGMQITGVCAPSLTAGDEWMGLRVLGADAALFTLDPASVVLVNGVGKMPGSMVRAGLHTEWTSQGFQFPSLVHPAAWVAPDVVLGPGVQVMAGAMVQPGCTVGSGSIINTRVGVDHDGQLAEDVHLAPGAILCGDVQVDAGAFIGAGAVVLPGCAIGAGAVVAAGALVKRNVDAGAVHRRDESKGART